ncbi:sodium- and chloride-dependent GABA transporter 2-like [Micropterus dolomieu]|uniref:sodium- and chloride-dependent GABA transporter 2-like n=1 Tax=Micropterus dolomieu TaxID=147949 RepID=UPI001E8EC810|nr:sodium- and chloride-dependent GABA transporter 2-like [Micropterus dolomieu]
MAIDEDNGLCTASVAEKYPHGMPKESDGRGYWGTKAEFILTVMGAIIGPGNVWRFPYLCYRNGGGVFLIPYILFMFTCGVPLFFLETALGQYTNEGGITCWRKICPLFQGIGYASHLIIIFSATSYIIIIVWAFFYLFSSFSGDLPWATCGHYWNTDSCFDFIPPNLSISMTSRLNTTLPVVEFWQRRVLKISGGIEEVGSLRWELVLCLILTWVICYFCVWKGIKSTGKGGMYLLQLLDHHVCSGTTLLLLSLCQSVSIAWVYGADRFYGNIIDMIGYRPYPLMKYCWCYITPLLCFGTFIFSIVRYSPLKFSNTYVYPLWANILGWFIATISLSLIPLFVLHKLRQGKGSLRQRFLFLCQPVDHLLMEQKCLATLGTNGTSPNTELKPLAQLVQ